MEDLQNFNPAYLLVMTAVFAVGSFLLYKIFWKPLITIMDKRETTISSDLASAEDAKKRMEQLRDEYDAKLRDIQNRADQLMADTTKDARRRATQLEAQAHEEIRRTKEAALAELERERNAAIESLRSEVADISLTVARTVLEREIDEKEHKAVIERMLVDLEKR